VDEGGHAGAIRQILAMMPTPLQTAPVIISKRNMQGVNLILRLPLSPTGQPCAFCKAIPAKSAGPFRGDWRYLAIDD